MTTSSHHFKRLKDAPESNTTQCRTRAHRQLRAHPNQYELFVDRSFLLNWLSGVKNALLQVLSFLLYFKLDSTARIYSCKDTYILLGSLEHD